MLALRDLPGLEPIYDAASLALLSVVALRGPNVDVLVAMVRDDQLAQGSLRKGHSGHHGNEREVVEDHGVVLSEAKVLSMELLWSYW